ncbi:MAG: hypothetical protein ABIR24_04655 [Verrucomicrobiota bacterium]
MKSRDRFTWLPDAATQAKETNQLYYDHKNSLSKSILTLLTLTAMAVVPLVSAQSVGDFRSATNGNWNAITTWERFDGSVWVGSVAFPTNITAGVITILYSHNVTNTANVTVDQVIVDTGGVLVASVGNVVITNGTGTDFSLSGTFVVLSGSSALTIQLGADVVVESGGLIIHSGTSGAFVNNSGGTLRFASGGTISASAGWWNHSARIVGQRLDVSSELQYGQHEPAQCHWVGAALFQL